MKVQKPLAFHHIMPALGRHSLPPFLHTGAQTKQPPLLQEDCGADS